MTICYPLIIFIVLDEDLDVLDCLDKSLNSIELTNGGKKILWLKQAVAFLNMNSNPAEK